MLNRFRVGLAKQRNMSPTIGALINIYQTTAIMYSPLTLIGVATTLYGLWGGNLIREYLPWFTVWHLLGGLVAFILVAMIFFYKIIIPSIVAWSMQQAYKHRNPVATDLQSILRNQKAIFEELKDIKDRMVGLEGDRNA